jgi:hypothetical protein
MSDPVHDRFERLNNAHDDSDWSEVLRRAHGRRRVAALAIAASVVFVTLIVAPGIGLGGRIVGLFTGPGKRVPLRELAPNDRRLLVTSFCRHVVLAQPPGQAPHTKCVDGSPAVHEIANNGRRAYWKIVYPDGLVCVASGLARIHRDDLFGDQQIEEVGCGSPANLLPSPTHPITTQIGVSLSPRTGESRITHVDGLAGEGVAKVALVDEREFAFETPVEGRQYALTGSPDKDWVAVVAYDSSGTEIYRKPLPATHLPIYPQHPKRVTENPPSPRPPPPPTGNPIQHTRVDGATLDVYGSGVVVVRFTSERGPFAFLREHGAARDGVSLECGFVAFGAGRWATYSWGATRPFGREVRANIASRPPARGGGPDPPYDACSIRGHYGRRWDEHVGYRNAVEFPFNPTAGRFFDEQAAARRVAYFVRSPKIREIRRDLKAGETAPSSAAIAERFDESVVGLSNRDEAPPPGKVGVWSDGKATIVASEQADDGRRIYVTLDHGRIGQRNTQDLAFVF